jgi:hypothetical protein
MKEQLVMKNNIGTNSVEVAQNRHTNMRKRDSERIIRVKVSGREIEYKVMVSESQFHSFVSDDPNSDKHLVNLIYKLCPWVAEKLAEVWLKLSL